jgi:hypothetical protein
VRRVKRLAVTTLAMKICASRFDKSVSAATFVECIDRLIILAMGSVEHVVEPPVHGNGAARVAEAPRLNASPLGRSTPEHDVDDADELDEDDDEQSTARPASIPETTTAPAPSKRRPRISYDDRVRIRARYSEHMNGRQRAAYGFVPGLATEFGCSDASIYAIIKE